MNRSRLTTALVLLAISGLFALGAVVDFNQNRTFASVADRKVYDAYGNLLMGTNYVALLYYGPLGADLANLVAVTSSNRFRDPASIGTYTILEGTWIGATRTLTGISSGQAVTLQVRVWDTRYGATFNEAATNPASGNQYGVSCPFRYIDYPGLPPNGQYIENFRGFSLVTNPPPGVVMVRHENAYDGNCLQQVFLGMHNVDASSSIDAGWQPVGQQFSPFIDLQYTNLNTRFYRLHDGDAFFSNAVGYYRLPICAGGFSLVANQLDAPGGNAVSNVFRSPPEGTEIYKFDPATGGYISLTFLRGAWEGDDVDMAVAPGEGFFVHPPVAFANTFLGNVRLSSNVPIAPGFSIISSPFPRSGLLDAMPPGGLGFPVQNGDEVYDWICRPGGYHGNAYVGGAWEGDDGGAPPFIALGEGFWLYNPGPPRNWNGVYCVCP